MGWMFTVVSIACLVLYPMLSWGQEQPLDVSVSQAHSAPVVLVMGDSLSAAYGMAVEDGWVALLAEELAKEFPHYQVVNASVSGETTAGGLYRLPPLMQKWQPQVLVIELGANDALRGQDLRLTQRNIERMVQACVEADYACKVALLGVRLPTNYGPAYDRQFQLMYQQLAERYQLAFHPFFLEEVALDPDLMQADALHPNAQAQPVILDTIRPVLEPLLKPQP